MPELHRRGALAVLAAALLVFAITAATASAATYCVASAPNCSGTPEPDLTTALTKADADTQGTDTIVLPATTMSATGGYDYDGHVALEIDGQGPTATVLTLPGGNSDADVLTVEGTVTAPVTLNELGLKIPASSNGDVGFWCGPAATVGNVAVTAVGATGVTSGINLADGGSVSDTTVSVPTTTTDNNYALVVDATSTIQDSSLTGAIGLLDDSAASLMVQRVDALGATASGAAIYVASEGGARIEDSVLAAYTGAYALVGDDSIAGITVRQATIVGDQQSGGIENDDSTTQHTAITVSDSILAEPLANAFENDASGVGEPTITTDHSDYDHLSLPSGFSSGPGDLPAYVVPAFANPSDGDYRLMASSPSSLFAGDATGKQLNESETDLAGLPRFNGAARDLGAYQHQVPTIAATATSPTALTGTSASFVATGATIVPNDPLTYRWAFDDGQTATGASVSHTFTVAGTHTATVTVTDALGFTASSSATLTVTSSASRNVTAPPPSNALTVKSTAARATGIVTVRLKTRARGTARVTARFTELAGHKHRTITYARNVTTKVASNHAATLRLRPTALAKRHLRAVKREKVTITVTFTPSGGSAARRTVRVTV
jgi:PKD domain